MPAQKDSKQILQQKLWLGLSNFAKEPTLVNYYAYSECLDVRTDPYRVTLLPATQKESGGTVTDFLKWADITPASLVTYLYGDTGNIYSRTTAGSWSKLHQTASSHGNGLGYFYGDDYLYYTGDTAIGRYGPVSGTPTFTDDFLTAQGGTPQNTYSLALVSASSQSADAADSASLSVTGNLTLEAYVYLNSLPAVGSSMTLAGKWDESGTLRSYIMDIYGISGYFGDGSDGALTISSNTTEAPIDSACTGTAALYTLSATNINFAIGQQILIHQTQGTNAGQNERNVISGYTAGTITLQTPLAGTYTTGAQVRVLKQYTNVTINSGFTYTAKAWGGTVGGILGFLYNGTLSGAGNISATGCGYRGGAAGSNTINGSPKGHQGEGTAGVGIDTFTDGNYNANGNGGGGGSNGSAPQNAGAGGGGGNGTAGTSATTISGSTAGTGGTVAGSADLTTIVFGGGGGGGQGNNNNGGAGGNGGGILYLIGVTHSLTGAITSLGSAGAGTEGGGGGGAGGSILMRVQVGTLGATTITATGGIGGATRGGAGGDGRIHLDYLTSYTGSTNPTITVLQDSTLVTTATYQARLGISQNGTASEYLTKNLPSLTTGQWNRLSISWLAASSLATFYLNGSSLGTVTGTKTAIHDNASLLYVGANKGAAAIQNYINGYIDDVRVWGAVQSASDIYAYNNRQLTGSEANLKAYYKLNNAATDSTTNANNLTLRNTPSYTQTVPFVDPTTRLDIDQSYTTTGSTYTLPTSISEVAADQLPFTPANDPQKSIDVSVDTKGTGDWTITIHDQQNNTIASKTITNTNMAAGGAQEFTWATPWRIVIGKSYHAHITVSTGTSKIVTSSLNTLQSGGTAVAVFHTYYQFLVTDSLFHPIARMLNFIVIGNERYLAKWDGAFYQPNLIAFPQGMHARCFGYWGKYLAVGMWQEPASGSPNIYDFPTGWIYFWDGISLTFNFRIEVPEGQVNALFGMDSDLYYFAGQKGDLMVYQGGGYNIGTGNSRGMKVKRIPFLERSAYMEFYPQSITMWRGLLHVGGSANNNSVADALVNGIYSWGTLFPEYRESLSYDYVISTGNNTTSVKIGMIYPVGQKLLVGWKDGIAYGCDVIDPTAGVYYKSGYIQTNVIDGDDLWRDNLMLKARADHFALTATQGVKVSIYLDRGTDAHNTTSITNAATGKYTTNTLSDARTVECQLQATLTGDGSSSPSLLALSGQLDSLSTEEQF